MADKNLRVSIMLQMAERVLGPLKNISHGSSETAQTLKAAREQLKLLEAAQGDIGSFQRLQQTLGETESKLKSAREHLRATANAFAENDTHKTSATMLSAAQAADKLGAKFNVQQQNLRGLSAKLKEAGISTDNLATDEQQLRARIAATTANIDKQTAALKAQNEIQKQASGIRRAQARNVAARGNARGALLDGVALATTLGAPIKMAMDWEQRLAELNKVADKTPQELAAIANAAQSLAVQTGVAREEIIGAYIAASQAGFAESEWAQFAEVSAKMGVAFDTTGDKAGEMLKAWRSGMSLSMDQATLLAGTVNHIANSMNATATDIGGVLQRQGAYLSAMGLTQTQSAALAATMLSGGATEEIAATASKNFMKAMTVGFAATKSQLKVFEMLNLDPEKLAKQMQQAPEKAIVGVMQRLQKLAPDQLAPAMKMLFGDESIGPAAQIVKSVDGLVAAFAMADDRAKTLGSLQAEFDSMGNTTQQQMHKAREGVKVVTTALGAGLLPAINTTLAAFAPMALGLAQWMQANEGMVTTVVSIIAAIMAFKIAAIAGAYAFTFLKGAWLAGKAVLFALRTAWMLHTGALVAGTAVSRTAMVVSKGLTAAQWLMNAAMSANPIGLLIVAIVGLVTAGWLLYRNWESVTAGGKMLWSGFVAWLGSLWSGIKAVASSTWSSIVTAVSSLMSMGIGQWVQILLNFSPFGMLWTAFTSALSLLGIQVPEQFRSFGSFIIDGLIGGITGRLAALKDAVVGAATSAASWFKQKLGIASPSKVFTQFGGWISEGAAKGIEAGQAGVRAAAVALAGTAMLPVAQAEGSSPNAAALALAGAAALPMQTHALQAPLIQMAATLPLAQAESSNPAAAATPIAAIAPAAPRAGGASAPPAVGGSTYQITIHAAPGMDGQAIARAVAAELDRRDRAAGARKKSALHDLV